MRARLDGSTTRGVAILGVSFLLVSAVVRAQDAAEMFRRLDRNGDGKLSRDELPEGARPNFERVDTNGDGTISPDEHAAFLRTRSDAAKTKAAQPPSRVPESVMLLPDIPYTESDNWRQQLDLMLPRERKGNRPLPVVVFIHGGAWLGGDKKGGWGALAPLVGSGEYAGVSVAYRLSDEAIWPAQIHDCKAAIRWIRANARTFHIDPDRIGLMGGSAGGHLVAMLGTTADDPHLEGKLGKHAGAGTKVQCVVDEFGPADFLAIGKVPSRIKHDEPGSPESRLLGAPIPSKPDAAREASPVTYVSADDPPFLVIHGTSDDVVPFDQSKRFVAALEKAGVATIFIPVEGGGHGNFQTPEVPRRIRLFFDKHLCGQDVKIPSDPIKQPGSDAPKGGN